MSIHRELFTDLPPAEELEKMYAGVFETDHDADGYYNLVQYIAEKYGDRAYALAEEAFQEMGLNYDPAALRAMDTVRRVDYNFQGINVYNIQVQRFTLGMAGDIIKLYNREIRKLSYQAIMTEEDLTVSILSDEKTVDGLLVACNESGQVVGFVHCWVNDEHASGSVEALIFSPGRIYAPVEKQLILAAQRYFSHHKVKTIKAFQGYYNYPFYAAVHGDIYQAYGESLNHIQVAVDKILEGGASWM